ncbi:MAG: site-2 protease family protein [Acidobacteriota bacterium]|nr:MAG: site-2 protease family protein [Acidobacteriota bacterium]
MTYPPLEPYTYSAPHHTGAAPEVFSPPHETPPQPPPRPMVFWNVLLFVLTGFTTLAAGWYNAFRFLFQEEMAETFKPETLPVALLSYFIAISPYLLRGLLSPIVWLNGVLFSFSILLILGCHELGHYLTCRRYGVDATLPYFLPFPSIVGTMGAFIRIRSPIPTRKILFDIGVAGPIAGFVVAVPIAFLGLAQSTVIRTADTGSIMVFGEPLVMAWMRSVLFGPLPADSVLFIHPMAFAGWFGFLATAFNLLPVGQLDGGHMLYACMGNAYRWVGRAVFVVALVLSLWWPGWLLWCVIFALMGFRHPRVQYSEEPLDGRRLLVACFGLAMLVLTFIPVPVWFVE